MCKKISSALLALLMLLPLFCACGKIGGGDGLSIVCTIFPCCDWTVQLLGDNPAGADVSFLLGNGVDLHSYQPTAKDIVSIAECDLFIYVGGESDKWVDEVLKGSSNPDRIVIDLLTVLGDKAKEEEEVEGMQEEEEEEEGALDEHVWLSLKNASLFCGAIADAMIGMDPDNEQYYRDSLARYSGRLEALDLAYEEAVKSGKNKTLLFADRFPFRYLVDDYGLSYYAAFAGCSSEINASFETIAFLASKADELALGTVFVTEKDDRRIAEAVIQASKTKFACVRVLDSMQSTTAADAKAGVTYLSVMESNLNTLTLALNDQ